MTDPLLSDWRVREIIAASATSSGRHRASQSPGDDQAGHGSIEKDFAVQLEGTHQVQDLCAAEDRWAILLGLTSVVGQKACRVDRV